MTDPKTEIRIVHTRSVLTMVACALAAWLLSCSNQGEGERCDTRAGRGGDDDCRDGLVCTPFNELNSGGLQNVEGLR